MSDDKAKPCSRPSRRTLLHGLAISAGGTAILLAGVTPAAAKMPQKAVKYQDTPKGKDRCDACVHFQAPSSCTLVEGPIAAAGWCTLYVKKS
jgi:hypothetical protein